MGTAMIIPVMPQTEAKSMMERRTAMGCREVELPRTTGSRTSLAKEPTRRGPRKAPAI